MSVYSEDSDRECEDKPRVETHIDGTEEGLEAWLAQVSKDYDTDVTSYFQPLKNHALRLPLLDGLTEGEWQEIAPSIGHRVVFRRAAKEIAVRAHIETLHELRSQAQQEYDTVVAETAKLSAHQSKLSAELEVAKSELAKTSAEVRMWTKQRDSAVSEFETACQNKDTLEKDLESAKAELAKAQEEQEKAMKFAVAIGETARKATQPPGLAAFEAQPLPVEDQYATVGPKPTLTSTPAVLPKLDSFPWFCGKVSRQKCEAMLTAPGSMPGDFAVRASESESGTFSLSVRMGAPPAPNSLPVKHFRIRNAGGRWNLSTKSGPNDSFPTIPELIQFVSRHGEFSGVRLLRPVLQAPKPMPSGPGMRCTNCPYLSGPNDLFCGECGQKLVAVGVCSPPVGPPRPLPRGGGGGVPLV